MPDRCQLRANRNALAYDQVDVNPKHWHLSGFSYEPVSQSEVMVDVMDGLISEVRRGMGDELLLFCGYTPDQIGTAKAAILAENGH